MFLDPFSITTIRRGWYQEMSNSNSGRPKLNCSICRRELPMNLLVLGIFISAVK